jgi:hypothetical protein
MPCPSNFCTENANQGTYQMTKTIKTFNRSHTNLAMAELVKIQGSSRMTRQPLYKDSMMQVLPKNKNRTTKHGLILLVR